MRVCKDALAGISNIYLASFANVVTTGYDVDNVTGQVSDLPTDLILYRYEVDDLNANLNDAGIAEDNGAFSFNPEVVARLQGITYQKRKELLQLIKNRLVLFIEPHRGSGYDQRLIAVGLYRGLQVTTGGFEHGAAMGDFSGMNLTFSGQQAEPSRLVEPYTDYPLDNFTVTVSPAVNQAQYVGTQPES